MTRRRFLRWLIAASAAGVATPAYAFWVEPGLRLIVRHYTLRPPAWPRDMPLRIVALSDPHLGAPYMSLERYAGIVAAANSLEPDLIVLLGDYEAGLRPRFVTQQVSMPEFARESARLAARCGVVAILGNHDWWSDPLAQHTRFGPVRAARALLDHGIPVLHNDAIRLSTGDRPFWVLGLGDQLALLRPSGRPDGVDDLAGTLAKIGDDAPALLLAHEPDIFPQVPSRVALTLCGHTHGGQIRLFGYSPRVPSAYGNRYAYGHIVEDGRHLVVSGGLGRSVLPVRVGVPPEITVVELA